MINNVFRKVTTSAFGYMYVQYGCAVQSKRMWPYLQFFHNVIQFEQTWAKEFHPILVQDSIESRLIYTVFWSDIPFISHCLF